MTSFTYNVVPVSSNDPSQDQPQMLQNTNSINSLLGVDHVSFNSAGSGGAGASGGQHLRVTYNDKTPAPAAQVDPLSLSYTKSGTASTVSQLFYKTQDAELQTSAIRAWGFGTSAGITALQSVNVFSFTNNGVGNYSVVLTTGSVTGSNFGVHITSAFTGITAVVGNYVITAPLTFTMRFFGINGIAINPTSFTFSVYQI